MNPTTFRPGQTDAIVHHYQAFGMSLESSLPFPGLEGCAPAPSSGPPISFSFGPVPATLEGAETRDEVFQSTDRQHLLHVPGLMRMMVSDGTHVRADALRGHDTVQIWNSVLGTGVSLAGFQRGHIPLHASAVLAPGGAVAFSGMSGKGKSTLVAALVQREWDLLTDDLCLVRCADGNHVGQGPSELRLWGDAVEKLGWDENDRFAVQRDIPKFIFRQPPARLREAPLVRLYALAFAEDGVEAGIRRLTGVEAVRALVERLRLRMRTHLLPSGLRRDTFLKLTALSSQIEIFQFARPRDHGRFDYWLDRLIAHIQSSEAR